MTDRTPDLATLLAHADWLHRLGQQLCRDAHGAADAAQDALLSTLQTPPPHAANLRGYLARTLRNLLGLQARAARRVQQRERRVAQRQPQFAEAAAAVALRAELHQFLGRCVLALPEPQRAVVLLHYYEALPVAAIAVRTGLTADAVRGHLRRARDTLRTRLGSDADPSASRALALLSAASFTTTMTLSTKSLAAAGVVVLALLLWSPWLPDEQTSTTAGTAQGAARVQASAPSTATEAPQSPTATALPAERTAVATTGSLQVRARWSDGSPAAAARLVVTPDLRAYERDLEVRTDVDGSATVHDLPCADGQLRLDWRGGARFTITAGHTTELELSVAAGVQVRGVVVDAQGAPVPTARIWLSRWGGAEEGMEIAAVERDGTFVLRDVPAAENFLAAIASGYRASTLTPVRGPVGSMQEVRIELREPGVALHGHVRHHDGRPAKGTRVLVGLRENKPYSRESVWSTSRPPFETRCDERGDFRADGLQPSSVVPVWLCGDDTAPCKVMVSMPESGGIEHHFTMTAGATVRGRATTEDGTPVTDVYVVALGDALFEPERRDRIDHAPPFAAATGRTDADGHYELHHVATGTVTLRVLREDPPQRAQANLRLHDGETARWDPVLTSGAVIRGTVVDDRQTPLAGWTVRAQGETDSSTRRAQTHANGGFEVADCGAETWQLVMHAPGAGYKFPVYVRDVAAGTTDLRIVIPTARMPSSIIAGRVQHADDSPVRDAIVWLWCEATQSVEAVPDHFEGPFRSALLAPGAYRALAEQDGRRSPWTERFVLREGATFDVGTLTIGACGSIDVLVRDTNGAPLTGIECHAIETIEGCDTIVGVGLTKQGQLRLENLRLGDYRLRTMAKGMPRFDTPFTVTATPSAAVTVTMPTGRPCIFVTQPARRGALQYFAFRWQRDGGTVQHEHEWLRTRDETRIARHLIPGDYLLTITHPTGASSENRFTVRADDPEDREIAIRLP